MSKEFEDSGNGLQSQIPPDAPSLPTETTAPSTVPCCTACGTREPADAGGLCPTKTCRCFRVGNPAAVVHTARAKLTATDISARDELIAGLLAERGNTVDIVTRIKIGDCATATILLQRVSRRLEEVGPTTAAGRTRSLVPIYAALSARVEKLSADLALPHDAPRPNGITEVRRVIVYPGLDAMPSAASYLAHDLLSRQVKGEVLTERELGALDVLESAMRGEVVLPPGGRSTE
jgi:hypothetical protein